MLRRLLQRWLAQPIPEPTRAETVEQIEVFRRSLKRFEAELDEAMTEHRALRARMAKVLERAEKRPPEPAGPTIDPPQGKQVDGPVEDRWTALARARKQQRAG